MITNKKTFIKQVKRDFKQYINDTATIEDAENQLMIKDSCQVEFYEFRKINGIDNKIIKLYDFIELKNGKYRFVG